jgi:membrane associated rhomboid family serine protease
MFTDCKNWIKSLFDSLPFFVKWVIILNILFCILNLFTRYISFYLADIPYFTIFYGQIWRLFTTAFITTGLFSLIFGIYIFNKYSNQREKDIGTVKYALYFFRNCFFIQVIYCIIFFIISLIINNFNLLKLKMFGGSIRNEGLWPILILEITLICLENPEREMTFFLIPCPIKAKFYPLALLCIFTLLNNFVIDFELLSAIAF